jgi:hypothetical protein
MRINYIKLGSVLRLVKFKNIIHSRCPDSTVIYLTGQDLAANPVLFGVLVMRSENYENYREGFEYFFNKMDQQLPKLVIRETNSEGRTVLERAMREIAQQRLGTNIRIVSHYNVIKVKQLLR